MPKRAKELSAIEVKRLRQPGFHAVGGVSGLHLRINDGEGKSWILRTLVKGKRCDIGLGGFPDVPLIDARNLARHSKESIRAGSDPVEERIEARRRVKEEMLQGLTFAEAVDEFLATGKLEEFKNSKHRDQWRSTLIAYAVPVLGAKRLQDITPNDVKAALTPIWMTKNETATRVRGRIERVLAWASVAGHRSGENPARWKDNLKEMLPSLKSTDRSENQPALALASAPIWYRSLQGREGIAAMALSFLALSASRSGEVRGAKWAEIDDDTQVWIIQKERMKMNREHRIPLSQPAIDLLGAVPRLLNSPLIFPSPRGLELSDMSLSAVMRRMHQTEIDANRTGWVDPRSGRPAVPHGLRSTFRDWVAEKTDFPSDLAEMALAHKVGSAVELAYRRGDMMERRREMMEAWARFIVG